MRKNSTLSLIYPYFKKAWLRILSGLLILVLVDMFQLYIPKIMQHTIDKIGNRQFTHQDILLSALIVFLLAIGIFFFRFLWRIILLKNGWIIDRELRKTYFEHLLKLSQNFYNKSKTGDLMAYAINDMNAVRMLVNFGLVGISDIVFFSIATLIFMVNINLKLTIFAILPLPVLSFLFIYFGKKIRIHFGRVQKSFATMSGTVQESISGIRIVKVFGQEDAQLQKVSDDAYDYVKENIALVKIMGFFHPVIEFVIGISFIITLYFGGKAAISGLISMGQFIAFVSYLGMIVWPMIAIGWVTNLYQRGSASLKRFQKILSIKPEITDNEADFSIKKLDGSIKVRNLKFKYKEELPFVFDDISFEIENGKTLAIIGKTGCGKSTLIDLFTRIQNPPKNSIFIGNSEIFKIPLKVLRNAISVVPQDTFLFSDKISENIVLGREYDYEKMIKAAKIAKIHDEIIDFKNGFDTIIGERGVTLSGGQKQRLAIARAIYQNPTILILDDSLSAVDTETEKEILQNLLPIRKNKTTVIISHRISTIKHADKIIVLDKGKIVQEGVHEELIKQKGLYTYLWEKQQLEEKLKTM